jgi:hypothetical protein
MAPGTTKFIAMHFAHQMVRMCGAMGTKMAVG